MTFEEELICHPENRELFVAWHEGEITLEEAVYIVRRSELEWRLAWMPRALSAVLIWFYELFNEPLPYADADDGTKKEDVDELH